MNLKEKISRLKDKLPANCPINRVTRSAGRLLLWIQKEKPGMGRKVLFAMVVPTFFLYLLPLIVDFTIIPERKGKEYSQDDKLIENQKESLVKEIRILERRLATRTGSLPYLVINTSDNSFRLYANRRLIREGICSTGSFVLLRNGDHQQWMFETPKGFFRVQSKTTFPVWKKPDWAFVEEGLPVPPPGHPSRFEYGVLGDYALGLGDGYLIHGTLYQRFLGMPVTHGCVRMKDDDLEAVYTTMSIGSKVYIY